ncbi:hypothetical protein ACHAXT_010030 [Thalassiosira profunda]
MARVQSLNVDAPASPRRPRNPYGPAAPSTPVAAPRTYLIFGLAMFAIYSVGKLMLPSDTKSDDERASKGGASGGWGSEHNHPVGAKGSAVGAGGGVGGSAAAPPAGANRWSAMPEDEEDSYDYVDDDEIDEWSSEGYAGGGWEEDPNSVAWLPTGASADSSFENADLELREADLLTILSPIVVVPVHPRPEYERYQKESEMDAETIAGELLNDMATPHGKAFDFMLNVDTRPIGEDAQVVQRYVLTLLFYATGGRDDVAAATHFLTSMHECHWTKKDMLDNKYWGFLSGDDQRLGVTKCNADMMVTEIRLADLNLVGFIPEELKYLSSLKSFDIQTNHLGGPIPKGLGELGNLIYLSLDGNSFSGTIPDVFYDLLHLERAYFNSNDFNGSMPLSLCSLRESGELEDLWSDCGSFPIKCNCCTACCDLMEDCAEVDSRNP